MLNCVIPMLMSVVYDHDGYVEKNTGDGFMAIIGADASDSKEDAANKALDVATISFYVLQNVINPFLIHNGIEEVRARIGIDLGQLIIGRVGLHTGSAKHERNFLVAVGPTANIASKIQGKAGTDEIWVGDLVKQHARDDRQKFFKDVT